MSNMKASFGDKKTKHMSKDKRKMHHWCLCHCWLLLESITWNLTTWGSHLIPAFIVTHSKCIQFTFHFYRCFCKSKHVKKSLVNFFSKGQHATTHMKSVRAFLEHCWCMAFFLKKFISACWLQIRMELQKKVFCKKCLTWVTNQEGSSLGL
jgi:hypothetical protein